VKAHSISNLILSIIALSIISFLPFAIGESY
jgi:hypothetical protein